MLLSPPMGPWAGPCALPSPQASSHQSLPGTLSQGSPAKTRPEAAPPTLTRLPADSILEARLEAKRTALVNSMA